MLAAVCCWNCAWDRDHTHTHTHTPLPVCPFTLGVTGIKGKTSHSFLIPPWQFSVLPFGSKPELLPSPGAPCAGKRAPPAPAQQSAPNPAQLILEALPVSTDHPCCPSSWRPVPGYFHWFCSSKLKDSCFGKLGSPCFLLLKPPSKTSLVPLQAALPAGIILSTPRGC